MKPLLVSSGEPAGIGPDLCLALADADIPVVVLADRDVLAERARRLGLKVILRDYLPDSQYQAGRGEILVWHQSTSQTVIPGVINPVNSTYVMTLLQQGIKACLRGDFAGLVTAPVHKAVINQAGIPFSGHTEFLAAECQVEKVVMMLVARALRVALLTTHLPLRQVPDALTITLIIKTVEIVNQALINDFGIKRPNIAVAGLNPHAGESGYLGREEIDIIIPALNQLKNKGLAVSGPWPADTMFLNKADVFLAMYHDQGLPVLKYSGFEEGVNVTLGLPIIRTSVDHGTALDLAGSGKASPNSLKAALALAWQMHINREKRHDSNQLNCRN